MSTLDLSQIPLGELLSEVNKREQSLFAQLRTIGDWRNPENISPECITSGTRIVAEVATKSRLTKESIMGRRRDARTARARMVCMVALCQETGDPRMVARFFNRDPGTVIHALKTIDISSVPKSPNLQP